MLALPQTCLPALWMMYAERLRLARQTRRSPQLGAPAPSTRLAPCAGPRGHTCEHTREPRPAKRLATVTFRARRAARAGPALAPLHCPTAPARTPPLHNRALHPILLLRRGAGGPGSAQGRTRAPPPSLRVAASAGAGLSSAAGRWSPIPCATACCAPRRVRESLYPDHGLSAHAGAMRLADSNGVGGWGRRRARPPPPRPAHALPLCPHSKFSPDEAPLRGQP